MSEPGIYLWGNGELRPFDKCDVYPRAICAADSWLVSDGRVLAIDLHRERFLRAVNLVNSVSDGGLAEPFWDAALAAIPREGDWFPRVELRTHQEAVEFLLRLRPAPLRSRSVTVTTFTGRDPRTRPRIKGPDLESMLRIRTVVQPLGADEAVILSPEGWIVEGAYSAIAWWRGEALCVPLAQLDRIDSVTARVIVTLATALGIETREEAVTPAELAGLEVWSLSALHGPRIITNWIGVPQLAEQPARLDTWRRRLDALRKPL